MIPFFRLLFDTSDFPARWHCGNWTAGLGWLHILSDVAIWGAYMAIPLLLAYFVIRRRDTPFLPIFWMFVAFIFACGTNHLVEATIFWWPAYRLSGLVKLGTAAVSWLTVVFLIPTLPRALALPRVARDNVRLKESLSWLENIFEAAPDGMVVVDEEGSILHFNRACAEIFGYSMEEFRRLRIHDLVPEPVRDRHPRLQAEYMRQPEKRPMGGGRDLYGRRKDGSEVPLEIGLNPIEIQGERMVVASVADITRRKVSEAERARLASMVDATTDSIIGLDLEGRITSWNHGAEALLEYVPGEVIGQPLTMLVPMDGVQAVETVLDHVRRAETLTAWETTYLARSGKPVDVRLTVSPLLDHLGRPVGAVHVAHDITESKRARRQLEQLNRDLARSNRELDDFAYVASHDMRAPLEGVHNLALWIEQDAGHLLPEASRRHLAQLQQRVTRAKTLLSDLLEYSRAGRVRNDAETVNTRDLIDGLLVELSPPAAFTVVPIDPLPVFSTMKTPFQQVLRNLIGNAMKHRDRDGCKVAIRCAERGDWYEFSVEDDGPGIESAFHDKIFGLFETIRPKDQAEGSGMGLAIAKRVVECFGGSIHVESVAGRGARFRFTWPRVPRD